MEYQTTAFFTTPCNKYKLSTTKEESTIARFFRIESVASNNLHDLGPRCNRRGELLVD